jgi:hypothetical protein
VNELLLLIEDMFLNKDRGYVATGNVSSGPIRVGDRVWVSTVQGYVRFEIVEIQSLTGRVEQAEQGEHIGHGETDSGGKGVMNKLESAFAAAFRPLPIVYDSLVKHSGLQRHRAGAAESSTPLDPGRTTTYRYNK